MDDRTGEIHSRETVQEMDADERAHMHPMNLPLSDRQQKTRKVGRNEPCPCGSGLKFKRCHLILNPSSSRATR